MEELSVYVIIPALNEQNAVAQVVSEIPKSLVTEVIVVDNGSSDDTFHAAQKAGATALLEPKKGYGQACIKGIDYVIEKAKPEDIVVFIDGDYSDYPEEMKNLLLPIQNNDADLVIGSRALGERESGSMTYPQRFGNWLATTLMRWIYGVSFTDLGPFRAIRFDSLIKLGMKDTNYGWTIEMQIKASKMHMRSIEVPVNYRKRIGISKVSGTVKGTILAGYKILWTIFKYL